VKKDFEEPGISISTP